MLQDVVRPAGPYSLALSARLSSDATRTFRDGVFTTAAGARAWQRPDGRVVVSAPDEQARESILWQLALDADHSDFVRRFRDDALIGRAVRELRGLRPIRTGSVAQA